MPAVVERTEVAQKPDAGSAVAGKKTQIGASKSYFLTKRQLFDYEVLSVGGFAPVMSYMNERDYQSVVDNMHMADGELFPVPIVLRVPVETVESWTPGQTTALLYTDQTILANLKNTQWFTPDLEYECQHVLGTINKDHPSAGRILRQPNVVYVHGDLEVVARPPHYDFVEHRLTPAETKARFAELGWTKVVGFQTRNPMHRSHFELSKYAMRMAGEDAKLMLHPVVGETNPGDVPYPVRVQCYKKLLKHYDGDQKPILSLLPIAMYMAGPREAVWHAIIRRNYGCTHFVVGRDHAGCKDSTGKDFYGAFDAHALLDKVSSEIGIEIIKSEFIVYVENKKIYLPLSQAAKDDKVVNISGTELRRRLRAQEPIPSWFTFPEVATELRKAFPVQRGRCVYFVGLSGSGKSTLALALAEKIQENEPDRVVTVLDGDIVRMNLSKGLGFSKIDRSTNVRRIGFVASEIAKHGGLVLCANIAPYLEDRSHNRSIMGPLYTEVFVNTPLAVCEQRDVKGMYAKARAGIIKQFTGISDPFETPVNPEFEVGTQPIAESVEMLYNELFCKK